MRLDETCKYINTSLENAGINDAVSETRIILREVAGIDPGTLLAFPDKEVDEEAVGRITSVVNRRLKREPLQYILGIWNFMGLDFEVAPGVLIPRADTEILTECALKDLHDGMKLLDLCTGTGCIAISLLSYSNGCSAVAVDISPDALNLSRKNADRLLGDKGDCLTVIDSDLYEAVDGRFDMIVSNPPYINTDVIDTLEAEVKDYEPHLALDGGSDGLDLVRRIIEGAPDHLIGGGSLMMEIGYDQGEAVSMLMKEAGFIGVEIVKDYAGLDRVVKGIRSVLV